MVMVLLGLCSCANYKNVPYFQNADQFDGSAGASLYAPYYYLQQRDIVYVEPNEAMVQNAKVGRTTQLWVRGASITISLGSLLYRVLQ